jgi:hypothetical protein
MMFRDHPLHITSVIPICPPTHDFRQLTTIGAKKCDDWVRDVSNDIEKKVYNGK